MREEEGKGVRRGCERGGGCEGGGVRRGCERGGGCEGGCERGGGGVPSFSSTGRT